MPALTKAQIKRRRAKAAAVLRKAAAASGSAAGEEEEEEEEEGSDASSDNSEPFRPRRPPLDFSADGEFRRSMHLPPRPGIEAEIDKMVAESEARHAAKLAAAAAMPPATRNAVVEKEGADTSDGAPFSLGRAAAPAPVPVPAPPTPTAAALRQRKRSTRVLLRRWRRRRSHRSKPHSRRSLSTTCLRRRLRPSLRQRTPLRPSVFRARRISPLRTKRGARRTRRCGHLSPRKTRRMRRCERRPRSLPGCARTWLRWRRSRRRFNSEISFTKTRKLRPLKKGSKTPTSIFREFWGKTARTELCARCLPLDAVCRRARRLLSTFALSKGKRTPLELRCAAQREMATPSDGVAAALARVDAADALHHAAAITRELAALPGSELVVALCCEALAKTENARTAAASADATLLVLEALRRHARCVAVVKAAWYALNSLLNATNAEAMKREAVEHGAMELALIPVRDMNAGVDTVAVSLSSFSFLTFPNYVARAVQLGGVEVRFVLCVMCGAV